ncbi:MAG: ABC transporter ATP-binding protein [Acidimicrobiia bacterium]
MKPVITLESVDAGYGGVPVVRQLSLHVDEGEVVALLGANGAGKTTTLLTISGLLPVLGGTVTVLESRVGGSHPHRLARAGLAHVPEDRSLFYQLTVQENLRLGSNRHRLDLERVFRYFPALRGLRNRLAGLLSGGEQQMLALGRALAAQPRILMVDEMSLGLAPVIVEELLPVFRRIADESGVAILLVEQHVGLALEVADRAYILSRGRLVLEGNARELARQNHLIEVSYLGDAAL